MSGSLDPPPVPEAGQDLPASGADEAVARWNEGAFFLDIRPRDEWESRRVSGAFPFEAERFDDVYFEVVASFGTEVPLFVYGAGPDSFAVRRVVAKLQDLGHFDVGFVTGGLPELTAAGVGTAGGPEEGMP
ncbi:MAG TPA: rhodanese-like domain-containing protein [bacterium]|nr:rhodanese-like domain-containing protein [bacterium]